MAGACAVDGGAVVHVVDGAGSQGRVCRLRHVEGSQERPNLGGEGMIVGFHEPGEGFEVDELD